MNYGLTYTPGRYVPGMYSKLEQQYADLFSKLPRNVNVPSNTVGNISIPKTAPLNSAEVASDVHASLGRLNAEAKAAGGAVPAPGAAGSAGGLSAFADRISNAANKAAGVLGDTVSNVTSGKGVVPKFANLANVGMGIAAGASALKGINDYQAAKDDTESLVRDILNSAAGNPNYHLDLSADQLQTLRKLRNGTYDTSGDFEITSLLNNLGQTAAGAGLGFLTGGPTGAVLGGLGGVVNGVSSNMIGNQQQITSELQSLYDALYQSEMLNKQMRRDAAMQRYANSLYA